MNLPPPLDLLPALSTGLRITLILTVAGSALGVAVALTMGLLRISRRKALRALALSYIEFFRGTSALVQLFWVYFALPFFGLELPALLAGVLVLGLNAGAYGAEVVRGAMESVPYEQWEAAHALNFSRRHIVMHIILPQALPAMLPPGGNLLVELLKNTALVSMITLADLTFRAQTLRAATLRTGEIFGLILLLYFAIALALTWGVRALERRVEIQR